MRPFFISQTHGLIRQRNLQFLVSLVAIGHIQRWTTYIDGSITKMLDMLNRSCIVSPKLWMFQSISSQREKYKMKIKYVTCRINGVEMSGTPNQIIKVLDGAARAAYCSVLEELQKDMDTGRFESAGLSMVYQGMDITVGVS